MGYLVTKAGSKFFYHKHPNKKYTIIPLGAISHEKAKTERDKLNIKYRKSKGVKSHAPIQMAYQEYLAFLKARGFSEHVLRNYPSVINAFIQSRRIQRVIDYNDDNLIEWNKHLEVQPSKRGTPFASETIRSSMGTLRHFYHWMISNNYLPKEKFAVKLPAMREDAGRTLSPEEAKTFVANLHPCIYPFTRFIFNTGGRFMEVLTARYEHIDRVKKVWTIPETKTGPNQTVALSDDLLAIIPHKKEGWLFPSPKIRGAHIGRKTVYKYWHRAQKAAGIVGRFRIHDARVNYATNHYASNLNLRGLMKQLRWKSEKIAMRYVKVVEDQQKQEANRVPLI